MKVFWWLDGCMSFKILESESIDQTLEENERRDERLERPSSGGGIKAIVIIIIVVVVVIVIERIQEFEGNV